MNVFHMSKSLEEVETFDEDEKGGKGKKIAKDSVVSK